MYANVIFITVFFRRKITEINELAKLIVVKISETILVFQTFLKGR